MIKACSGKTIFLGLSEGNIGLLKNNKPISFCLSELKFNKRLVVIAYDTDEFRKLKSRLKSAVVLCITEEGLVQLRAGKIAQSVSNIETATHNDSFTFLIFLKENEAELYDAIREYISPKTIVSSTGFDPTVKEQFNSLN